MHHSKPRILVIENSIAVTGALQSILRSSQGLQNSYKFVFLLPRGSKATQYVRQLNFEVHEMPMMEIRKNVLSLLLYIPMLFYNSVRLFQFIKKQKIYLIVSNDFYNLLPTVYRLLGGKVGYICYVRFLPSKFPKPLVKFWCALHRQHAQTTVAVSEAVKRELPFKENVFVIGNELPAENAAFSSTLHYKTILYPSNYIQGKGHEIALESFSLVARNHPHWKLKFIGGDMGLKKNKEFKEHLVTLSRRLNLETQVEWLSFSEKMSDEYYSAAFVLNFSESESFSMTVLEAMYYGRPVIATRSGGPSEIIDQNDSGILVDLKDVNAMVNAMNYMMDNPEKRESMAQRAYKSVRTKYSYENTVQKLGELYRDALDY
jgi:glycosyltransferase involved in cell wall biosynthesis